MLFRLPKTDDPELNLIVGIVSLDASLVKFVQIKRGETARDKEHVVSLLDKEKQSLVAIKFPDLQEADKYVDRVVKTINTCLIDEIAAGRQYFAGV